VPHAGWICSAAIAGEAIGSLAKARPDVDVVVVFGAIHTPVPVDVAVLDSHRRWSVPGGSLGVTEVRDALAGGSGGSAVGGGERLFTVDNRFHENEHAVEVELPLVQQAWPNAAILPVEVPVVDDAPDIGRQTARRLASSGLKPVFLASSDLTHYGPNYRFAPAGVGPQGLQWAAENDRRLLQVVATMRPESVVPEVRAHANACGAGAIAAMMAACQEFGGATASVVLRHANSCQTLAKVAPQPPTNAVGYAAVLIG
jgi:AmmeMemoRadiSam system protein B